MAKKRKTIITNNREIYEKFNMLNFSPEVILKNAKLVQIEKIIKNVNKGGKILDAEVIGDYILIRKLNQLNYNIYLK